VSDYSDLMIEPRDISAIRRQLGLTQSQLAEFSQVSQSLIAKIESGNIDPSYSKAKALSDALERIQRRNSKKAKDIMAKHIISVSSLDRLEEAARLMRHHSISQLPVFEGEKSVGSISERTILRLLEDAKDPSLVFGRRVRDVMEDAFPTVSEDTPVELLYSFMDFFQAVLVSKREKVKGIVTKADLLKFD
jgi:predicted transcriptional regulator